MTAVSSFTSELANATIGEDDEDQKDEDKDADGDDVNIRHAFFPAGCPTVSVNNMTENLAWACDPYIGENIISIIIIVFKIIIVTITITIISIVITTITVQASSSMLTVMV